MRIGAQTINNIFDLSSLMTMMMANFLPLSVAIQQYHLNIVIFRVFLRNLNGGTT